MRKNVLIMLLISLILTAGCVSITWRADSGFRVYRGEQEPPKESIAIDWLAEHRDTPDTIPRSKNFDITRERLELLTDISYGEYSYMLFKVNGFLHIIPRGTVMISF